MKMDIEDEMVMEVDKEKLKALLDVKVTEWQELDCRTFAIWEDKICVDPDCVFWDTEKKLISGKVLTVVEVACRFIEIDPQTKSKSFNTVPDFSADVEVETLKGISKEVRLVDFIRFNYNPRIMGNQKLLMKHIRNIKDY